MILSVALLLYYLVKVASYLACHFALVNQDGSVIAKEKNNFNITIHNNIKQNAPNGILRT